MVWRYTNSTENAAKLSVDEKTPIQALDPNPEAVAAAPRQVQRRSYDCLYATLFSP